MYLENSVKHLWEGASTLSPNKHVTRLLKSYYISKCRSVLQKKTPHVTGYMCTHCSSFWNENEFQLKLRPQAKCALSAKSKKLIAKLAQAQSSDAQGLLTQKQRRRAKWLKKRAKSQLEIYCKFCAHKSSLPLEKPKKQKKTELAADNSGQLETAATEIKKTGKKKKRKDKTAGLKIPATIPKLKPASTSNVTKVKIQPKLKQTIKVQKQKQQNKTQKVSKTQQNNKLLQLAEMLKKQNKNSQNKMENRLQVLME